MCALYGYTCPVHIMSSWWTHKTHQFFVEFVHQWNRIYLFFCSFVKTNKYDLFSQKQCLARIKTFAELGTWRFFFSFVTITTQKRDIIIELQWHPQKVWKIIMVWPENMVTLSHQCWCACLVTSISVCPLTLAVVLRGCVREYLKLKEKTMAGRTLWPSTWTIYSYLSMLLDLSSLPSSCRSPFLSTVGK